MHIYQISFHIQLLPSENTSGLFLNHEMITKIMFEALMICEICPRYVGDLVSYNLTNVFCCLGLWIESGHSEN